MITLNTPIQIKGLRIRNRIVMPPMKTNYADEQGFVTDEMIEYYVERARNGVGLVIVEATAVTSDGAIGPRQLNIYADQFMDGLRRLANNIKHSGAAVAIQLVHGGAKSYSLSPTFQPLAPSDVALRPGPGPRPLSLTEIEEIKLAFASAAERAAQAGFDAIELHAAHYFLLSQFLSPLTNRRDDRYGGDVVGRSRFLLEIVAAMRQQLGPEFPLLCRTHCRETLEGGLDEQDILQIAQLLEHAGVDVIDTSAIVRAAIRDNYGQTYVETGSTPPKGAPDGYNAPYAARIKRVVKVPVITVGKIADPAVATNILEEGLADMVAVGRGLIVDPEVAAKMLAGRGDTIIHCDECDTCFRSIRTTGSLKCSLNKDL
ncbi:MAG: NADH:flavin oxidoreductase [Chloroflexi bacterium]|nr:NADH:flavin oxidoreductase [Chloroflexota bacterium]MCL5076374.1 NADH:flavin oxidoreductase [Chloroflexota bacterium]